VLIRQRSGPDFSIECVESTLKGAHCDLEREQRLLELLAQVLLADPAGAPWLVLGSRRSNAAVLALAATSRTVFARLA